MLCMKSILSFGLTSLQSVPGGTPMLLCPNRKSFGHKYTPNSTLYPGLMPMGLLFNRFATSYTTVCSSLKVRMLLPTDLDIPFFTSLIKLSQAL